MLLLGKLLELIVTEQKSKFVIIEPSAIVTSRSIHICGDGLVDLIVLRGSTTNQTL